MLVLVIEHMGIKSSDRSVVMNLEDMISLELYRLYIPVEIKCRSVVPGLLAPVLCDSVAAGYNNSQSWRGSSCHRTFAVTQPTLIDNDTLFAAMICSFTQRG